MLEGNPNFAFGKRVLEECNTPEAMLDGKITGFDGKSGYCGIHIPAYITIDLGEKCPIGYIRFLLMNRGKDDNNHGEKERKYFYRLLVSSDDYINNRTKWSVVYDSREKGVLDWQCFTLSEPMNVRYIRVHAIDNRKNNGFHVIQFEAYEKPVEMYANQVVATDLTVNVPNMESEIGDGLPLYKKLKDLAGHIRTLEKAEVDPGLLEMDVFEDDMPLTSKSVLKNIECHEDKNKKIYTVGTKQMIQIISCFANDVKILERNSDGIERAVISPVQAEMSKSRQENTKSTWIGLFIGIFGILISVLTTVLNIFVSAIISLVVCVLVYFIFWRK